MNYYKYGTLAFAVADTVIFVLSQVNPDLALKLFPMFAIMDETDQHHHVYMRLVGVFFLLAGICRFYGALCLTEKIAVELSLLTWVVELTYFCRELLFGPMLIEDNISTVILAPLMLWLSWSHYDKTFHQQSSKRD